MKKKISNKRIGSPVWEKLQLSLLYLFTILFVVLRAKVLLGPFNRGPLNPQLLSRIGCTVPGLKKIPKPENLLVLYAALLRPITSAAGQTQSFSYLVKFNLILVLLLEMIQFLFFDFWDVIFKKGSLTSNLQLKKTNLIVYSFLFSLFAMLYSYCYVIAVAGRIPAFPGILNAIPRSAQYWIKSKTI